jgi:hypothetical protein
VCVGKSIDRAAVLEACIDVPSEQRYLPVQSLQNAWLYSLFGGPIFNELRNDTLKPGIILSVNLKCQQLVFSSKEYTPDKHTWHSSITLVSKRAYPVYLPTGPP